MDAVLAYHEHTLSANSAPVPAMRHMEMTGCAEETASATKPMVAN